MSSVTDAYTVEGYHTIRKLTLNKVYILKPDSLSVQ